MDKLAIVVPCYNEQEVLPLTFRCLSDQLCGLISQQRISADSIIIYADDGSRDNTW